MYKIDVFCDDGENANTYLLTDEETAIVIDPANNTKTLQKFIGDKKVVGVFLTHGHIDHFKTLNEVYHLYNCPVYLTKNCYLKLNDLESSCQNMFKTNIKNEVNEESFIFINDGSVIKLGNFNFKVVGLFGHTNCSIGFLDEENKNFFTGDAIFLTTIGRYDLATGNFAAYPQTIKKIKNLDDLVMIYPGHDENFLKNDLYKYNRLFSNIK